MKVFRNVSFALVSFCLLVSASFAGNGGNSQSVKRVVDIGAIPAKLEAKHLRDLPRPSADEIQTLAAPALSYLQIDFVYSDSYYAQYPGTYGWEGVSGSQYITLGDHGGAQMRVVTQELGYGNNPVATWNGGQVSASVNYKTDTICVNWARTGYDIPCLAGQTVVGFRKYWNFDGYQNGVFTYQNQSTNSPWNTMYDSMSIK